MYRMRRCLLLCVVVCLLTGSAWAQVSDTPRIRYKQVSKILSNGDAQVAAELVFSTQMYTQIKSMVTNTSVLVRELGIAGQVEEVKDIKCQYDDDRHAIKVNLTVLGALKNRGRDWISEITDPETYEVVAQDANSMVLLTIRQLDNGVLLIGTTRGEFPEGTKNLRFEPNRGGVLCELPAPPVKKDGTADADMQLQVRPELMSCLYKCYGNPKFTSLWVARAVFRNNGTASLEDLRVRFRIPDYSSSWSPWSRTRTVYPTQTVVEPYFPILTQAIRDLHSDTPAMVEMEYSYRGPDGKTVEETDSRRVSILGLNQVMFSSLPMEECTNWLESFNYSPMIGATFVTNMDPIVTQYAGMAAKLAGGVAASTSDENALKFMKGVYDLMVANGIKYQSPPGMLEKGVVRQHVKFGRDVLQNRAGTCIDLAILYASTCQAGGLDPGLVMIPGHCFPFVRLPSGTIVGVEATAVSGTDDGKNVPFEKAAQVGMKELSESIQKGALYLVDVKKLRAMGVPTPELPNLPPSTLNDWGIRLADAQQAQNAPQPQGQRQGQQWANQPQPTDGGQNLPQPPDGGNQNLPQPPDDGNQNLPQPQDTNTQVTPPVNQAGGGMKQVAAGNGSFTIALPAAWQSQAQAQGQAQGITAMDPGGSGAMVMCLSAPKTAQNLQQFVQSMLSQWQQSIPGWKTLGQEAVQVGGKQGYRIRATGTPNNNAMYAEYVFVLSGPNQFLLGMQCPQQVTQQFQGVFQQVLAGWQVQ